MPIKTRIILNIFLCLIIFNPVYGGQKTLIKSKINYIYHGTADNIWICTSEGVSTIKYKKYKDIRNIKSDGEVNGITADSTNNIYFNAGKKIVYYNPAREAEEKILEPSGMGRQDSFIKCLAVDKNNNLWIGRCNDMLSMYNGKLFVNYPVWDVNSIGFTSSGDVWLAAKTGLYRVRNGIVDEFNIENSDLPDNNIKNLTVDIYDNLWLATDYGLVKYNNYVWIIYNKENSPLKNNSVSAVSMGGDDSLLIGMQSGDLQTIKDGKWREIDTDLKSQGMNAVYKGPDDDVLIGTDSCLAVIK